MSPTVDDLSISLSIKPTSELGKLRKQLKTLVGDRGRKKLDLGKLSPTLERDIRYIKDKVRLISPTVFAPVSQQPLLKAQAAQVASNLGNLKKNVTDYILGASKKVKEGWMKMLGIPEGDIKALKEEIGNYVDRWREVIQGIAKVGGGQREKRLLEEVSRLIQASQSKAGKGLRGTILGDIFKSMVEAQTYMERIMRSQGLTVKAQTGVAKIHQIALEKFGEEKLKGLWEKTKKNVEKGFEQLLFPWVTKKMRDEMMKELGIVKAGDLTGYLKKIDIEVIGDVAKTIEFFKKAFPRHVAKDFEKFVRKRTMTELKGMLTYKDVEKQATERKEMFGDKFAFLSEWASSSAVSKMDELGLPSFVRSFREVAKVHGVAADLLEAKKLDELQKQNIETLIQENFKYTKEGIDTVIKSLNTREKKQQYLEKLIKELSEMRRENLPSGTA